VLRLEAPLFRANATLVHDHVKALVGRSPTAASSSDPGRRGIRRSDITSAETLTELATTLRAAGVDLALAEVRRPVLETARRSGLLDTLGDDRVFRTVDEAGQAISRAP
jgi:hypothetical protein